MDEIELPAKSSRRILDSLLRDPKWSPSKVAKTLGIKIGDMARLRSGQERLRMKDVDLLAKASGTQAALLIFESFDREEMEKTAPGLYDLGLKEIERHKKFLNTDFRKPAKKRRSRTAAA
jgi:hypothetical protein